MDPATLTSLPAMLSTERFTPYLAASQGDAAVAARLYTWNVEVSAAFWGPLHAFEVIFRNTIHDALRQRFTQDDWWTHPQVKLTQVMTQQRDSAVFTATRVAAAKRRPMTAPDVVAQFNLGFWTGLLSSGGRNQYETLFWQPTLVHAFPNYRGTRAKLHTTLDSVRLFRNRIAHHEPIFRRHLAADHGTLGTLASYISDDARDYVSQLSRVPAVLQHRTAVLTSGHGCTF